jgi:hypothetical protein
VAGRNVVRELLVLLGVRISPRTGRQIDSFENSLKAAKLSMAEVSQGALTMGRNLAIGALGAAVGLAKLTTDAGKAAVEIDRQAKLMLLTRQEYQEWLHVSQVLGATQRDLADTMLQVNDASQRALMGSKEMTEGFAAIGITVDQLRGKNPGEILELIASQIELTTDKAKALGIVSRLLGEESGRKFGPLLMSGTAAIRAMRQEAHELGIVMSDEQLAALKAVSTETRRLMSLLKGLRNELASRLAPIVGRQVRGIREWLAVNRDLIASGLERWIERIRVLMENLDRAVQLIGGWDVVLMNVAVGAGMLLLLANLDKVLLLTNAIRAGWVLLGTVAAALGIGLLPLTAILLAIAAAMALVAAAAVAFYLAFEDLYIFLIGGNSLLEDNLDLLESYIPIFGQVRDLVWALVQALGAALRTGARFGSAIAQGLSPALEFLAFLLDRVHGRLEQVWEIWERLNARGGHLLSLLTGVIRAGTVTGEGLGASAAAQLQGNVAHTVRGQIAAATPTYQQIDNRVGGAVTQLNTFVGNVGDEVGDALMRSMRRAAVATQGGRR